VFRLGASVKSRPSAVKNRPGSHFHVHESTSHAAEEAFEEKYELKAKGYSFNWLVLRVAEAMGMTPDQVTALGKYPQTVKARALLCY